MTCSWQSLPYPTPKGQVGGHEGVGKIVKLGPGSEREGIKIGDRVGIKWMASICGNCRTFKYFDYIYKISKGDMLTNPKNSCLP